MYLVSMTEWSDLAVGDERLVDDDGGEAQVVREEPGLFVIRRHYEGAWQRTVWVRESNGAWSVAREAHVLGETVSDLDSAIQQGILRSREALSKSRKPQDD